MRRHHPGLAVMRPVLFFAEMTPHLTSPSRGEEFVGLFLKDLFPQQTGLVLSPLRGELEGGFSPL
jgi:hypothetical protein